MSRNRLAIVVILVLFGGATAIACGPDFPLVLLWHRSKTLEALPADSFAYEARHLVAKPTDALQAVEFDVEDYDEEQKRAELQHNAVTEGLTSGQAEILWLMKNSETGDQAFAKGDSLPAAIRLYTAGTVDFLRNDASSGVPRFEAVLRLSDSEKRPRALWAGYMLGRIYAARGDAEKAAAAFATVRDLAVKGLPDPLGLAVASYGEEALLHLERANAVLVSEVLPASEQAAKLYAAELAKAVELYAQQAARGSHSAKHSLLLVAHQIVEHQSNLEATIDEPIVQRLVAAYALAQDGDVLDRDSGNRRLVDNIVSAIERQRVADIGNADRLAAMAYQVGLYRDAELFALNAQGPLAAWVKAKLAFRYHRFAEAYALYAEASKAFPDADRGDPISPGHRKRLLGERGILTLSRGEYVDALTQLYAVAIPYWEDVAHVAEKVVTVNELKRFVDAKVPRPDTSGRPVNSADEEDERWQVSDPARQLRDLLARRLVREGRYDEALPYFHDPGIRQKVGDYAGALSEAQSDWRRIDRARAWYRAAVLARTAGMDIMGTEVAPDYFFYHGRFGGMGGNPIMDDEIVSKEEYVRVGLSEAKPDLRFHYRYVAMDEAVKAADLLPPRSQAFAAVLCKATGWMFGTPGTNELSRELYRRYVKEGTFLPWAKHFGRQCPEPDFDGAATLWRRQAVADTRHFLSHYRWPIGGAFILAIAATVWLFGIGRHKRGVSGSE